MKGNYAPIYEENTGLDCPIISGALPNDLTAMYLRNGPNPQFEFNGLPYHCFDGDGMVHSITFKDGKAWYSNKWVRTRRFVVSQERGYDYGEFGEMNQFCMDWMPHVSDPKDLEARMGRANTAFLTHAQKTYCLDEQDKPYEIQVSFDPKKNLTTVGRQTFDGQLQHPFSAHTRVDKSTGEAISFCMYIYVSFSTTKLTEFYI